MTQTIALSNKLVNTISIINTKRVKKHLSHILSRLESANVSNFTELQIKARSNTLEYLRQYIELEEFPINEHSLKRHAIFRDQYGNYCAVGYLMHRSGFYDLVDEITENNNLVYINEIDDKRYIGGIAALGISVEEAAMIQPTYGWEPGYGGQTASNDDFNRFIIITLSVLFFLFFQYFAFLLINRLDKPRKDKMLLFFTTLWGASLVGMAIIAILYSA